MNDTHGLQGEGWYGFDLDGTLAEYDGWKGIEHIGKPIKPMCELAREIYLSGIGVKIVTARVAKGPLQAGVEWGERFNVDEHGNRVYATDYIRNWCKEHIGFSIPVTESKDGCMLWLFDDRSVQVEKNTGKIIGRLPEELRDLYHGRNTYRFCLQDHDDEEKFNTISVEVEVRTEYSKEYAMVLINDAIVSLDYGDYDSADEFVEAIMDKTGLDWKPVGSDVDGYLSLTV